MGTAVRPLPQEVAWQQRNSQPKGARGWRASFVVVGPASAAELLHKPQRSHLGTCSATAPSVWVTLARSLPARQHLHRMFSHWLNLHGILQLGLSRVIRDWLNQTDSHS